MPPLLNIALLQFKPRKGDYAANLARLRGIFAQLDALEPRPQVVHAAETAMSGYFVEGGVRDVAVTAGTLARDLDEQFQASGSTRPIDMVIGFYEKWRGTLYNSAAYVRLGEGEARILHVHRKAFLPTYGVFDEERFVERGHDIRAFDTPWGRAAILVCEDAWHSFSGTIAALDNAQVIFVSSAAPARGIDPRDDGVPGPGSVSRWDHLVRAIAEEHGVFVSLVNLVGSEGGKIFAGGSFVAGPGGDVQGRAPIFEESLLTLTLDLGDMTRARADTPLLSDLRTVLPYMRETLDAAGRGERPAVEFDAAEPKVKARAAGRSGVPRDSRARAEVGIVAAKSGGAEAGVSERGAPPKNQNTLAQSDSRHPSNAPTPIPTKQVTRVDQGAPPPLDIDAPLVEAWLVNFIRDEMKRRGFTRAVVGVSGGVDSSVTAYLAARALGPANVLGMRLPYRTSSPESLAHAQLVIDALGIEARTLDISGAVDGYLAQEPAADDTRRGNVMARVRMIALFDLSAAIGGVPLGTGNKTERLFGYFTWHADDSPPINPLGDLFKTQVWQLARHLGVPEVIVSKPASADLITGQTDEGDFGISYAKADVILNWLVSGFSGPDLVARGFPEAEVELVQRRLEGTHWKRRLPTVAMLTPTAIGESYLRPVDY